MKHDRLAPTSTPLSLTSLLPTTLLLQSSPWFIPSLLRTSLKCHLSKTRLDRPNFSSRRPHPCPGPPYQLLCFLWPHSAFHPGQTPGFIFLSTAYLSSIERLSFWCLACHWHSAKMRPVGMNDAFTKVSDQMAPLQGAPRPPPKTALLLTCLSSLCCSFLQQAYPQLVSRICLFAYCSSPQLDVCSWRARMLFRSRSIPNACNSTRYKVST